MIFMQEEMQRDLKKDIQSGKIAALRLVKTKNAVIRDNLYAQMYFADREVCGFDNEKFYLKTKKMEPHYHTGAYDGKNYRKPDYSISDGYCECEAYYAAFSYYDGDILRSVVEIPAAVKDEDRINITEYEVLRSY